MQLVAGASANPGFAQQRISYVLAAIDKFCIRDVNWIANILAEIDHEDRYGLLNGGVEQLSDLQAEHDYGIDSRHTNRSGVNDLGNQYPGDGAKYKGRGMIQLTGRASYTKFAPLVKLDLVNHPEVLLQHPDAQAYIAVYGMLNGSFRSPRSLSYYFGQYAADGGTDEMVPSAATIHDSRGIVNVIDATSEYQAKDITDLTLKYRGVVNRC